MRQQYKFSHTWAILQRDLLVFPLCGCSSAENSISLFAASLTAHIIHASSSATVIKTKRDEQKKRFHSASPISLTFFTHSIGGAPCLIGEIFLIVLRCLLLSKYAEWKAKKRPSRCSPVSLLPIRHCPRNKFHWIGLFFRGPSFWYAGAFSVRILCFIFTVPICHHQNLYDMKPGEEWVSEREAEASAAPSMDSEKTSKIFHIFLEEGGPGGYLSLSLSLSHRAQRGPI